MNLENTRIVDIHQWTLHLRDKVDSKKSYKHITLSDSVFITLLFRPK